MAETRTLEPSFRPWAEWWLDYLRWATGEPFVVTSARRSTVDQARLYERYLAGKSGVYTVLPPGVSQHERGFAVDIARTNRRAVDDDEGPDPLLLEAGAYWRSLGGVWGGERDPVHFEAPKSWTGRS